MGAIDRTLMFPPCDTGAELREKYKGAVESDLHERGRGAYQGTLPPGLKIHNRDFATEDEAYDWFFDEPGVCEKWEDAHAVRLGNGWFVGAICAT